MYDLSKLTLAEIMDCRNALRQVGEGATTMETVGERVIRHLYNSFIDRHSGNKAAALVRLYITHPYGKLDDEQRAFADRILNGALAQPDISCLTLLASAGERAEWNSRKTSTGHKAIPLPSEKVIEQLPMVSQLVKQLGVEIHQVIKPDAKMMVDAEEKTYNVFFVEDAVDSPYIPAQKEFVIPYGVRSVIGFGGLLPMGSLFAVIIFGKVKIARETADMFKTLALGTKMALLPFITKKIFS